MQATRLGRAPARSHAGAIDEIAGTVDKLRKGAGASLRARSPRVEDRRPATHDDLRELKAELRGSAGASTRSRSGSPAKRKRQARREAQAASPSAVVAGRRVLITGVGSSSGLSSPPGSSRARRSSTSSGSTPAGPRRELGRTELIEADIRDPSIAPLIARAEVDTVVHNPIVRQPGPGMSARAMHDINVIGSLQLLDGLRDSRRRSGRS